MNISNYIASGILEEYVLGLTSPQETREVECLSSIYPEIRAELDTLTASLEQYALTLERDPPTDVKEKLLSSLEFGPEPAATPEETAQPPTTTASIPPSIPPTAIDPMEAPVRPLLPEEEFFGTKPVYHNNWLVAASVGLLMLIFAYFLYSQLRDSQQTITALRDTTQSMQERLRFLQDRQIRSDQELAILRQHNMRVIELDPVDKNAENRALVYWNKETGQVNLEVDSLSRPSEAQQYQLWAIVDGKPVDAGVFDKNDTTQLVAQAKRFLRADAFAITLERRGGSPTPTMEAMVAIGKVDS